MAWRSCMLVLAVALGCDRPDLAILHGIPDRASSRVSTSTNECVTDDDCTLLPSALTCCNECPPSPPFEPAPRWVLDGMLIQHETECAESDRLCIPARCEPPPQGCEARAVCRDGRCTTDSTGCERPTS